MRAAATGDLAKVQAELQKRPDLISYRTKGGWMVLHYAAAYGQMDVARRLISDKANVNARTDTGITPLHYAAAYGRRDIAELLIGDGADRNATDGNGDTPLHMASSGKHEDLVELLLAKKADVDTKGPRRPDTFV